MLSERTKAPPSRRNGKSNSSNTSRSISRIGASPGPVNSITQLQRIAGNQAVQRMVLNGALQDMVRTPEPEKSGKREASGGAEPTAQLRYDPKVTPPAMYNSPSWLDLRHDGVYFGGFSPHEYDWLTPLNEFYDYMNVVKPTLEDDEDIAVLEEKERLIDKWAKKAEMYTRKFDSARVMPQGRRMPRKTSPRYSLDVRAFKGYKEYWMPWVVKYKKIISSMRYWIKNAYPMHRGGFSAKGRAHDMLTQVTDFGAPIPMGYGVDNTFIENVTLDGRRLSSEKGVLKITRTVGETAGPLVVGNRRIQPDMDPGPEVKARTLQEAEGGMADLVSPQPVSYANTPISCPRGGGQFANMANTNATGYAWLAGAPNWNQARWEWLHVRAASLGGRTDGRNLVAGTRDCNTHMIPFESNIRALGTIAGNNLLYKQLNVNYSVANVGAMAKHAAQDIRIGWQLEKESTAPFDTKEPEGEAIFKPLQTGSNISKKEVELLETTLRETRRGLDPTEMDTEDDE